MSDRIPDDAAEFDQTAVAVELTKVKRTVIFGLQIATRCDAKADKPAGSN
jgi:hypothetical protein